MVFKKNIVNFIVIIFLGVFLFLITPPAQAADMPSWTMPDLQIDINGLADKLKAATPTECGTDQNNNQLYCFNWIGEYIVGIYKYAISIVGILATIVMMIGGFIWLTAGGNQSRIGEAKSWIGASLTGLIIALSSYLILYQINPDLTKFAPLKVAWVKPVEKETTKLEDWEFDAGIEKQWDDASDSLKNLLACMRKELDNTYNCPGCGKISSISDSLNMASAGFNKCDTCEVGTKQSACAHTCQSCHYGGGSGSKSYAVDFGDGGEDVKTSETNQALSGSAAKCGAKYIGSESNHLHISTSECSKDGAGKD